MTQAGTQNQAIDRSKVPVSVDVGFGIASAITAGFCVTPMVMIIDKAVTQAASGNYTLISALRMGCVDFLKKPQAAVFTIPFALVWNVYICTYSASNCFDIYLERKKVPAKKGAIQKLGAITTVNMSVNLLKDVMYAKLFSHKEGA